MKRLLTVLLVLVAVLLAQEHFNSTYEDAQPWQKTFIGRKVRELGERAWPGEKEKDILYGQQLEDDQMLSDGTLNPSQWEERMFDRMDRLAVLYEGAPERKVLPKNPEEKARQGYYDILDKLPENPTLGDLVLNRDERDRYMASLPEEVEAYIEENRWVNATPLMREYKDDIRQLKPYLRMRDTILSQLTFPDGKKATEVAEIIIYFQNKAATASPQERGKYEALIYQVYKEYPAMKTRIEPLIEYERKLMRYRNAVIDRLLVKWGKTSTYLHPFNREAQMEGRLSGVPR